MVIAYILIIIGAIFFLKNIGLIAVSWSVIWPLIIVALGIYIAMKARGALAWRDRIWEKVSRKLD